MGFLGNVIGGTLGSMVLGLVGNKLFSKAKDAGADSGLEDGAIPGHNHDGMQDSIIYILSNKEWEKWRNDTKFGDIEGVKKAVYQTASGYWGFSGDKYENYNYPFAEAYTDYHKGMQTSINYIITSGDWWQWRHDWVAKNPSRPMHQLCAEIFSLARTFHQNDPTEPKNLYVEDYINYDWTILLDKFDVCFPPVPGSGGGGGGSTPGVIEADEHKNMQKGLDGFLYGTNQIQPYEKGLDGQIVDKALSFSTFLIGWKAIHDVVHKANEIYTNYTFKV